VRRDKQSCHNLSLEDAPRLRQRKRALRLLKQAVPEFVSEHQPGDLVPERRRAALVVS
jgi:hypothetical protein